MIVACIGLYGERVKQALIGIERLRPHVDRYVIIVDETVTELQKKALVAAGCEVYFHPWTDSMVNMRNQYLKKVQTDDWVIVHDPDEHFNEQFCNDVRNILKRAEEQDIDLLLINSHDIDIDKDGKRNERISDFFKNLIFRKREGTRYEGVGEVKEVHETLIIPGTMKQVRLDPKKYWYTHEKYWWEVWERAARNVFMAGGGNNAGSCNPSWKPLREICESIGLTDWTKARDYFRKGNIDPRLKKWLWDNRSEGFDYQHECVTGDTLVYTPEGLKRIDDCSNAERVLGVSSGKIIWSLVQRFLILPLRRQLYDLHLEDGKTLTITEENLVWTNEGWIAAKDLSPTRHYLLVTKHGKDDMVRRGIENPPGTLPQNAGQRDYSVYSPSQSRGDSTESFSTRLRAQRTLRHPLDREGGRDTKNILPQTFAFGHSEDVPTKPNDLWDKGEGEETQTNWSQNGWRGEIYKGIEGSTPTGLGLHSRHYRWRGRSYNGFKNTKGIPPKNATYPRYLNIEHRRRTHILATEDLRNKLISDNPPSNRFEGNFSQEASASYQDLRPTQGKMGPTEHPSILESQTEASGALIEIHQSQRVEEETILRLQSRGVGHSIETEDTKLAWRRIIKKTPKDGSSVQRVFDFTTSTGNFFANGILIHNCMEFGRWYFQYCHPEEAEGWKPITEIPQGHPAEVMRFVEDCYMKVLGRHADQPGKEAYTKAILEGKIRREDLPDVLKRSLEYQEKVGGLESVRVKVPINVDVRMNEAIILDALRRSKTYWEIVKPKLDIGTLVKESLSDEEWRNFLIWFYKTEPNFHQFIAKLRALEKK